MYVFTSELHVYMTYIIHVLMRDERRKKERSKQRQTNKQGKATQHTQGSLFLEKMRLHVQYVEVAELYGVCNHILGSQ